MTAEDHAHAVGLVPCVTCGGVGGSGQRGLVLPYAVLCGTCNGLGYVAGRDAADPIADTDPAPPCSQRDCPPCAREAESSGGARDGRRP